MFFVLVCVFFECFEFQFLVLEGGVQGVAGVSRRGGGMDAIEEYAHS